MRYDNVSKMRYDNATAFVKKIYKDLLRRNPDEGSLETYTKRLMSGELDQKTFTDTIVQSEEYKGLNVEYSDQTKQTLKSLFLRLLNRQPDKDAKLSYLGKLELGLVDVAEIEEIIKESDEYKQKLNKNNGFHAFCEAVRSGYHHSGPGSFKKEIPSFCCLIVEGRERSYTDVCAYITMKFVPQDTDLFVFCTEKNIQAIKASMPACVQAEYVTITKMDDVDDYNTFMMSTGIWEYVQDKGYDSCLVFQSDSFVFSPNVVEYIEDIRSGVYDIIGAPHVFCDDSYIVNGGLSLRNVEKMIECINNNRPNEDMAEDEFFNEYCVKPPIDISRSFAVESDNSDSSSSSCGASFTSFTSFGFNKLIGVHQMWDHTSKEVSQALFDHVLSLLNRDTTVDDLINECYNTILHRVVDEEGLRTYSRIVKKPEDIPKLEKILKESAEYRNIQYHEKISTCVIVPEYKNSYTVPLFDVVISRLDGEDVAFIEHFDSYPCRVFLYNKGQTIQHAFRSHKISIFDVPNLGHHDHVYVSHIVANYHNLSRPVVFLRCDVAMCPELFKILDSFETFGPFESLSQQTTNGVRYKSAFDTVYCDHKDMRKLNHETVSEIFDVKANDVKEFMERYTFQNQTRFVPGSQMYINHGLLKKRGLDVYASVKKDIEKIHSVCSWKSRYFSTMLERYFWSAIW